MLQPVQSSKVDERNRAQIVELLNKKEYKIEEEVRQEKAVVVPDKRIKNDPEQRPVAPPIGSIPKVVNNQRHEDLLIWENIDITDNISERSNRCEEVLECSYPNGAAT